MSMIEHKISRTYLGDVMGKVGDYMEAAERDRAQMMRWKMEAQAFRRDLERERAVTADLRRQMAEQREVAHQEIVGRPAKVASLLVDALKEHPPAGPTWLTLTEEQMAEFARFVAQTIENDLMPF